MKAVLLGFMMVCAVPAAAMAFQCPTLQGQIDKAVGKRFDKVASTARQQAAMGANLHKAGKHAESVKAYEDAAKTAGVQLMMKK